MGLFSQPGRAAQNIINRKAKPAATIKRRLFYAECGLAFVLCYSTLSP